MAGLSGVCSCGPYGTAVSTPGTATGRQTQASYFNGSNANDSA